MKMLDREGMFKAMPENWGLQSSESSQSVALVITFRIVAQFQGGTWEDWSGYEEHQIVGYFYIVKKDGQVNASTVENLAKSIGWDGNLNSIQYGPPAVVCQLTVAEEEYNNKVKLKVQWMNPEDHMPGPKVAPPAEVIQLNARYGSLLRAAAAAAKPKSAAAVKPAPPALPKPASPTPARKLDANAAMGDDDLPFDGRPGTVANAAASGRVGSEAGAPAGEPTE